MRRRLAEVAAEHLPPPASGRERDAVLETAAIELWEARETGEIRGPVYTGKVSLNKRREREKLDRLRRAVIAAAMAFSELEENVRREMWTVQCRESEPEIIVSLVRALNAERSGGDYFRKYLDAAEGFIDGADDLRRVRHPAAEVVRVARYWWHARTGKPAPRRGLNEASRFGKFLADVLAATGVDAKPRAAFGAWAEVAAEYQDPDPAEYDFELPGGWHGEVFRRAGVKVRKVQS